MCAFFWPNGAEETPAPELPFQLNGYSCFSLVHNCSPKRAQEFLLEYPVAVPADQGGVEYCLRIATLPDAPKWTAVAWPRPASFFDMQMVTMGLHGWSKAYAGAKLALFVALPDKSNLKTGPLLAHPYESGFLMEVAGDMRGIFQQWGFRYDIGKNQITEKEFQAFPNYTSYLSTPRIGFQMKWLENLERISDWTECSILLEG